MTSTETPENLQLQTHSVEKSEEPISEDAFSKQNSMKRKKSAFTEKTSFTKEEF